MYKHLFILCNVMAPADAVTSFEAVFVSLGAQRSDMNSGLATDPTNTAAFDALLDQLKCPVCKEVLKEPFVTDCGHTFCHACINHHLQTTSQRCPCCGTYMLADQVKPVFALDKVRPMPLP